MISSQYSILVIVIRVDLIVFNSKREGVCGTGFWQSGTGRREGAYERVGGKDLLSGWRL
jgi:hypothetical protein